MKGIPDGWMWQDIGNYYGAGAYILNWKENQYDLKLKSGTQVGSDVEVVSKDKAYLKEIKTAPKGTGDNAYIYLPVGNQKPLLAGTIPVEEKAFTISGATPDPVNEVISDLSFFLKAHGIRTVPGVTPVYYEQPGKVLKTCTSIDQYYSPPMDSIIYWFFKKSINLYGEALVKTIAYQKEGFGATDKGVAFIKKYWKEKGIPPTELSMVDGSGLSPLNRVTTHAQTSILQYAKQQPWFAGFYEALPEYNGMKIKSGTINGAKAFCGYHTSKEGKEYIFSFIVNNYNGSASAVVKKMYTVLDILK